MWSKPYGTLEGSESLGDQMRTFDTLHIEVSGPVGTMRLNRPERLNALSRQTLRDLAEAAQWWNSQRDVKVVVVSGSGSSFSAGFDLGDFASRDPEVTPRDSADLGRIMAESVTDMNALTIASIHGHCVGGGVVLAASCDLRVATSDALFRIPEVDLGIPLAWGGIPRLVRELGPAVTKELVLTCRTFGAEEAHSLRFINTVVDGSELDAHVYALAGSLAAKPGYALRTTKQQVNAVTEEMIGTGRSAADADALVFATYDPESRAASAAYLASKKK